MFPPLPRSRYSILYADPPWSYYGDPNKDQAAGKYYSCLPLGDLAMLRVETITAKPAVLFLWATCPKLLDAVRLMSAWGFHYRGVAYIWVKTTKAGGIIGGQGIRPSFVKPTCELVLVGSTAKTGRPFPLLTEGQGQVVLASRGAHSEKPAVVRERIVELLGDRPRIELFARHRVPGWAAWGLEVPR
jgi:N6-adenosine-specific RNA methylase IME4